VAKKLAGRSQNDLWTAATARQHGARLLTRNAAHFAGTPNLEILDYSFE
jgi:predicted nucleic acid-binding protein